jgi:hypothetical protein
MAIELVPALLFREYLKQRRQALLMEIDNIERTLDLHPRTSELRKAEKDERYQRLTQATKPETAA